MKKRMLITTIVMMLVLAVALTTSSLAWFSASQATVTATGGTFSASAAGSAANIGLATSAESSNWANTAPMTNNVASGLVPLCAISELTSKLDSDVGTSGEPVTLASIVNDVEKLNGAKILTNGEGVQVFPLNAANPFYKNTLASQANSVVFAKNLDANGTHVTSLKVTLKITSEVTSTVAAPNFYIVLSTHDGSNVLRTAVMSKTGGYVVYDFSSASENTSLSSVDADGNRKTGPATINNAQDATAEINFTNLDWAQDVVYAIHVYAWYEGGTLDVTTQSCSHTYELTLEAGIGA